MNSLRLRFLLGATLLLLLFVILTGLALQKALDHYSEQAEYNRLQGLVFSLLAAIEVDADGRVSVAVDEIPEPRLRQFDSGLSAVIYNNEKRAVWQSDPLLINPPEINPPAPGQWIFNSNPDYQLTFGFEWELANQSLHTFALQITDSASPIASQRQAFAKQLWWWLLGIALLLLTLMLALLHWGLKPLRGVTRELEQVRTGKQQSLQKKVPREIQPLAEGINTLLGHERQQQQRYRNALDDLAHSLKTPLAVMQSQADKPESKTINEQVERMEQIIGHQLQRAATAGRQALRKPIAVRPIVQRLIHAMQKVYVEKNIQFKNSVPENIQLAIDEADLMELLGNLLDNAAKFTNKTVTIGHENNSTQAIITIEDDGSGIEAANHKDVFKRGVRADTQHAGQGIGLTVARDIIGAYSGQLIIDETVQKGTKIKLVFQRPGAQLRSK